MGTFSISLVFTLTLSYYTVECAHIGYFTLPVSPIGGANDDKSIEAKRFSWQFVETLGKHNF